MLRDMQLIAAVLFLTPAICFGIELNLFELKNFDFGDHDYKSVLRILKETNKNCPDISRLYKLDGKTVEKRDLVVIEFTLKNVGYHTKGKPEFKYVGNMHGNEVISREVLLALVVYLCQGYREGNSDVMWLLDNTRIHILVTMNPDGWELANSRPRNSKGEKPWLDGRANADNVDLNRNFPEVDRLEYHNEIIHGSNNHIMSLETALSKKDLAPETVAVIKWIYAIQFVLSSNLHGGDLVANYPYDESREEGVASQYSASPDDRLFRHLARSYSQAHPTMADPNRTRCDMSGDSQLPEFKDGITNGAKWYSVAGGMQDFNYLATNCYEITLELGCNKFPYPTEEKQYWEANKKPLLNYMFQVHLGIKGEVKSGNQPVANATVKVFRMPKENEKHEKLIEHHVLSGKDGDYYRLLVDGDYKVQVVADGYFPSEKKLVKVRNPKDKPKSAQIVNFNLKPRGIPTKPLILDSNNEQELEDDYYDKLGMYGEYYMTPVDLKKYQNLKKLLRKVYNI